MADKIDANVAGLRIAEEASLKVLPGSPVWVEREPNTFDDLGGDYAMTARKPFSQSRQRKKGVVTDLDADGGYSEDLTQNNMQDLLQGFFFADKREKAKQAVTAVDVDGANPDEYEVAETDQFLVGSLILGKGFTAAANNGLKVVTALTADVSVEVADGLLVAEASPPADAHIKTVGHQFVTATMDLATAAGEFSLERVSGALDLTTLGLVAGSWVFIGDASNAAYKFTNTAPGYARVKSVAAARIAFDKSTMTPTAEVGTGKTIRIFFGTVLKNENDPALIKRRSYQLERTLGNDGVGTQAEYLEGAVPNELVWNSPLPGSDAKVTLDLSFVATDNTHRTGTEGIKSEDGGATIVSPEAGADAFNTASNIYRLRMNIIDPATLNPSALFARVTEWTLTVNNNVSPNKAQGVLGAFDMTAGTFEVDAELTAYFSTVEAVQAIRDNADVTFDAIYSRDNAAIIVDLPLIGLGGGRLDVQQDAAVMVPLDSAAAESTFGHTMCLTWLDYVPNEGVA